MLSVYRFLDNQTLSFDICYYICISKLTLDTCTGGQNWLFYMQLQCSLGWVFHQNVLRNVNRFRRSEDGGSEISELLTRFVYRSHVSPSCGEELGAVYFVNGTLACW